MEEKFLAAWAANREEAAKIGVRMRPVAEGDTMKQAHRALSGSLSAYGANAISTLCGICAGVVVYFILVIALQILRAEDVKNIRKGDTIIRILHLK